MYCNLYYYNKKLSKKYNEDKCISYINNFLYNNTCIGYFKHNLADLLMTSVSMSNTIIQQTSNYTFQIMRYGTSSLIPANTIVQITFPNAYASTSILGC